jgi:hypothetical protein
METSETIENNPELTELFMQDQKDRETTNWNSPVEAQSVAKKDDERRTRVQQLSELGDIKSAEDFYHSAMIFQHGETPEDFLQAHEFAKKSAELGDERGKWLIAASLDRYLTHTGQPQKYGTQYRITNGIKTLFPIDPTTTDEERATLNVPPLEELKKKQTQ